MTTFFIDRSIVPSDCLWVLASVLVVVEVSPFGLMSMSMFGMSVYAIFITVITFLLMIESIVYWIISMCLGHRWPCL